MRWLLRQIRRLLIVGILFVILLLAPAAYIETFCRADRTAAPYKPVITDARFQRTEANTYLTYPEWHIVYAYEGLAEVLKTRDEYAFDYIPSILGFWQSFCALNKKAEESGGADTVTRLTIHTIGVSFTAEMALKALYEETLGRIAALIRGDRKTPQDSFASRMADDYAAFLQQTPWYEYPFSKEVDDLWSLPAANTDLRGWERRLALGAEWTAKSAYAKVIAGAAAAAGPAQLSIRAVVDGISDDDLTNIDGVKIIESLDRGTVIEAPRYRRFTGILGEIAERGGTIVEIAGNDDVMVSIVEPLRAKRVVFDNGSEIERVRRDGHAGNRLLMNVKVPRLAALLQEIKESGQTLEHVYDY